MKFDLKDYEQPAHVQKKKKYATFTVREIGGPAELAKWKEVQAAKAAIYNLRIQARDDRMSDFAASLGQKVDRPVNNSPSLMDRLAHNKAMHIDLDLKQAEAVKNQKPEPKWEPTPEPKLSILQRIGRFFKQLWRDANF